MNFSTYPISRKAFKAKSCIDWLDVTIHTSRPTQFQHLQAALEKVAGKTLWVEAMDEREGNVATMFKIRFQDDLANNVSKLQRKLDRLSKDYPFVTEPVISGIEVACDFMHKGEPSRRIRDTLAMTYRLQSSLFAPGGNPRQFDPEVQGKGANRFMAEGMRLDPGLNFRIGNKWDDVSWQVYFKCVDKMKSISQSKWRARVEVTLKGEALKDIGLNCLSDLQGYKFEKLTQFFRFRRPVEPLVQAKGDRYKHLAITVNRRLHDATAERGIHSFNTIGRRDKWRKTRVESRHIEPDHELQDAVKGALRRLSL